MAEYLMIRDERVEVPDAIVAKGRAMVGAFADALEAGISAEDARALLLPEPVAPVETPTPTPTPFAVLDGIEQADTEDAD